jgi:hypothetical protein
MFDVSITILDGEIFIVSGENHHFGWLDPYLWLNLLNPIVAC